MGRTPGMWPARCSICFSRLCMKLPAWEAARSAARCGEYGSLWAVLPVILKYLMPTFLRAPVGWT